MKGSYSLRADVFTNFAVQESREIRWFSKSEGVGQYHNTAQRERCSYLSDEIQIRLTPVPQHSLLTIMFVSHYSTLLKMITDKSQTKPTTERLNINQVILTKLCSGAIVTQGSSFSTPFRWALFVTYCYNLITNKRCFLSQKALYYTVS